MPYAILVAVLVAADQLVKYFIVQNIALASHVPLIPYVVELTHWQNTGAAFSILSGQTHWLALGSLIMSLVLAGALWFQFFRHPLGKLAISILLAGAVGNLIDRVVHGYVVDMFNLLFLDFAVFNVADICVVTGGIAACLYYLFLADKLEPHPESERIHDHTSSER